MSEEYAITIVRVQTEKKSTELNCVEHQLFLFTEHGQTFILSSRLLHHVLQYVGTNISEEHSASIPRVEVEAIYRN
jgi:hypothetical protein